MRTAAVLTLPAVSEILNISAYRFVVLDDTESLRRAYADVCVTLGATVDVHLPAGDVRRGEALDIDASGALVVGTDDGTFTVAAGDVVHVRPA